MASLVVVVALVFVGWSFVYPVIKVIDSHVSKIHMVRHRCERKSYLYGTTVSQKLRSRLLILIMQFKYFDWIYDLQQ